jgi:hypothetical protein
MGAQSVYEGQPWQAAVLCVYPIPMLLALVASSAKRHQVGWLLLLCGEPLGQIGNQNHA